MADNICAVCHCKKVTLGAGVTYDQRMRQYRSSALQAQTVPFHNHSAALQGNTGPKGLILAYSSALDNQILMCLFESTFFIMYAICKDDVSPFSVTAEQNIMAWILSCGEGGTGNIAYDLICFQMSESHMEIIKLEMMKPYIWLQTSDGSIQQVEQEIAMFCPLICQEIIQKGMGSSKNCAISLPQRVTPSMLSLILDYCRFHQIPGRSNKERKSFDEKFIRMDTKKLCELTSAADSLQLKPLVDLTSRALARIIEGKTPEEIREIFHLPDDLTEEEKLEPLKNATDDPRIRLLNRLYAKKRKELRERERLKNVEVQEECVDERSVDDLLSFINGENGDTKGVKTSKSKKKNKRRKDAQKNSSTSESFGILNKESNVRGFVHQSAHNDGTLPSGISRIQDVNVDCSAHNVEFDDGDMDDEIDPALKEIIDREVEDFARRLNSDWPERMQEILSLGQETRATQFPINGNGNGNGSLRRCMDHPIQNKTRFVQKIGQWLEQF